MTPGIRRLITACSLALVASVPLAALHASAQAPTWPGGLPVTRFGQEGDVVSLEFGVTSPDGQPLSFSQTGLPPGLTINAQTGVVSGTLTESTPNTLDGSAGVHSNITLTARASSGATSTYVFAWHVSRFRKGDVFAGIGNAQYNVFSEEGVYKYTLTTESAADFVDHTGYDYGWGGGTTTGCGYNWVTRKMYFTAFDDDYDPAVYEFDPVPSGGTLVRTGRISTFRDSGLERGGAATGRPIDAAPESVIFGTHFGADGVLGTPDDRPGTMYVGHAGGYYSAAADTHPYGEMPADIQDRPIASTDDFLSYYYIGADGNPLLDASGNRIKYAQGVSDEGLLERWPGTPFVDALGTPIETLIRWGRDIQKFVPNGTGGWVRAKPEADELAEGFDAQSGWQGSDWLDLSSDQRTIYYTSEWGVIYKYDVGPNPAGSRQLEHFVTLPPQNPNNPVPVTLYALRLLPPGDGSGGVLVASPTEVLRITADGRIVNRYDTPADGWFALNISPDGKSVWSASTSTGRIYRWDIASGEGHDFGGSIGRDGIPSGATSDPNGRYTLDGLCVMGEYTAAQEVCGDGIDNDGDGEIDEVCQPIEACSNLSPGDDDGDGLVDSNDPDCPNTINVCATSGYTDSDVAGFCARRNLEGEQVSISPAPSTPGDVDEYTISGLPPGIVAGPTGILSGVPSYTIVRNGAPSTTTDYTVLYEVVRRRASDGVELARYEQSFVWTIQNVNRPPVALTETRTIRPGQTASFAVAAQTGNAANADPCAVDPDCEDTVTLTPGANPGVGTMNISGTTHAWSAPANFTGSVTYTYTRSDGRGGTAPVSLTINVVNLPPVAVDDIATTRPGVPVGIAVLTNDSDPDVPPTPGAPDTLTVTTFTQPSNGTVTMSAGSFVYTPASGFVGVDTFTYTISDGYGGTDTATVTITINNRAPIAIDDAVSTIAGYPTASFNVLTLGTPDSDPDGDAISITTVTTTSNGTLARTGNSFVYTPNYGFSGVDTFTYTITDPYGLTDSAVVTITVRNLPPVAVNDSGTTEGTRPVTIAVMQNDSDPDNHVISVTGATTPPNGTAVVNANGTITYTANPGFQGVDTFFYTITDGYGGTSTATVTITIGPPNRFDPCLCSTAKASPGEIWPPNHKRTEVVTITDVADPDGGPLTIKILGIYQDEPTNYLGDGDTTIDAGGVGTSTAWVRAERTGNPNIPGNGRVYEIVFEATAPDGSTCTGSVFTGVPHDQGQGNVVIDDGIRYDSTVAGGPIVRTALRVEGGLSDADVTARGFELQYVAEARLGGTGATGTANRELIIGSTLGAADDTADFNWTSGQQTVFVLSKSGDDVEFKLLTSNQSQSVTFDAECENGDCDDIFIRAQSGGTGKITLSGLTLNGLGIADTLVIPVGGPARSIHLSGLALGEGMQLTGLAKIEWTSTPPAGNTVNFRVQVGSACPSDAGNGGGGGNTPPVARSDNYSTDEDTPLVVEPVTGILLNDLTFAGPLSAELVSTTSDGTLTLDADGSFVYTPNLNFNGQDTYRYRVSDGSLWSEPALVTITVNPAVDPPVAVDDSATTPENTPVSISVLTNDSDPFGTPLSITAFTQPSNGSATISGTEFIYTPNPGYLGVDTFTYTITGTEGSDTATVTITVANINEPPVAVNDSYTTAEDTPLSVAAPGILGNDSDPDSGDALAAVLVTGPSNGTLTLNADGSFVYTPALNYHGTDSYTYLVRDGGGLESNVATVTITITPVNDPPVAVDDSYVVAEDSVLTINAPGVKTNDSDPDTPAGDLTISLVTGAQRGSLTLNPDGSFVYTPFPDVTGSDTFTYRISDGTGSDTAVATIAITDSPDPPVAVDDAATTPEDTPVTIAVLGNDSDPDTETLTIQSVTQPSNGTAAIVAGQIRYTPAPGFNGQDAFTYTITDGQATSTANVVVTITAVNDPPVATPDAYTTPRNTTLTIAAPGVIVNDTDPEGAALAAVQVSATSNGTVTLSANGSFVYVPATGFVGTDTFTYRVNDGEADSNVTTVTITVTAVNAPPIAVDDSASTNAGQAVTITVIGNDSDPDDDAFSVTANTNPSNGTVTRSGNVFTYTPNSGFTGTDTFTYTITDTPGATDTATVTITVSQVCDATSAPAAFVRKSTMLNGRVEGSIQMLGAYDATFNSGAVLQGNLFMLGTPQITVNGTPTAYGGAVNGTGSSSPTSHRVTINAASSLGQIVRRTNAITLPSVASPSTSYGGSNNVVLTTPGQNPGSFGVIRDLTLNAGVGAVTVPPGIYRDFIANSNSSFVIGVPGATTPSVYNFQRLTLNAGSQLTVVGPVMVTVRYGATWHGNMGAQARPDWLTLMVASSTVQLDSQMSFWGNLLAPNSAFIVNAGTLMRGAFGVDSLTVNSNGRVELVPTGCVENGPPLAVNDSYTTAQDTPLTVVVPGVLVNDTDPEGSSLTASLVSQPTSGTVTLNGTGSFTYTPAAGYAGVATFTYRVSDGTFFSSAATVTITITDTPDPPNAVNDTATTPEDTPVTINVLVNDTDPDTPTLTLQSITQPSNGTATIVSGQVRYAPNPNFNGLDTFTYTITDGTATDTATVTVTVTPVNDPPVAVNDSYTATQNTVLNASTVLVNDSDPENQSLTGQLVTQPSSGSVVFQSNGTFAYTPANNYTGTATFTYRANDGTASSNIATVTIVINPGNRPPVAANDAYSTDKNTALTIAAPGVMANDSDPDAGNTITASLISGTAANTGTVTLNGNGSFTFTPANNFSGTTTFRYRVRDNLNAQSNEAIVTITVRDVVTSGRVCYDGGSSKPHLRAQIDWTTLVNGDINARATVSRNYSDNTYGINKIGWGNKNRDFKAVYLSDYGQLAFFDKGGTKRIDFRIDYLSPKAGTPSGYGTQGVTSAKQADGGMVSGLASDIVSLSTSMDLNMNAFGYVGSASNHPLKSYSPSTNSSYTANATYPLWIWDMWYEATVKASTFGSSGFGTVTLRGLHASPAKEDVTTWRLINCQ